MFRRNRNISGVASSVTLLPRESGRDLPAGLLGRGSPVPPIRIRDRDRVLHGLQDRSWPNLCGFQVSGMYESMTAFSVVAGGQRGCCYLTHRSPLRSIGNRGRITGGLGGTQVSPGLRPGETVPCPRRRLTATASTTFSAAPRPAAGDPACGRHAEHETAGAFGPSLGDCRPPDPLAGRRRSVAWVVGSPFSRSLKFT